MSNFQQEINFVQHLINHLEIGPKHVRVGALEYSTNAEMQFYLDTYTTKACLLNAIGQITWKGGNNNLHRALNMVRTKGLIPAHGSRGNKGVPQVVIVMSDGETTDTRKLDMELRRFLRQKYVVFAIGNIILVRFPFNP